MFRIFKYSHISTKMRAKIAKMLNEEDYREMLRKKTVGEVTLYLKHNAEYSDLLENINESSIHRRELELLFKNSLVREAIQINKFTKGNSHEYLKYIFQMFEIENIKIMIRTLETGNNLEEISGMLVDIYKYSSIDFQNLLISKSVEELIDNLKGTIYSDILRPLIDGDGDVKIFDIEMALDMYYFKWVIKSKDKYLTGKNKQVIENSIEKELTLLNMLWIYRSKKYYNMKDEMIYRYLINIKRNHKNETLIKMVEAKTEEELLQQFAESKYSEVFEGVEDIYFEKKFLEYMRKTTLHYLRKEPFTIYSIIAYYSLKKTEIKNIVTIIEGIRYGNKAEQIEKFIIGV